MPDIHRTFDTPELRVLTILTKTPARFVLLVAMVATIGCDRVTKHAAATALATRPAQSFLGDTVRLELMKNTGGFLSLGADWAVPVRRGVLGVGTGLLLLIMAGIAMRLRWPASGQIGAALLVAGGLSNLADRLAYGGVVDFLSLGIGPLRTGIFNIADVAIMVGAGLIVVTGWRSAHPENTV